MSETRLGPALPDAPPDELDEETSQGGRSEILEDLHAVLSGLHSGPDTIEQDVKKLERRHGDLVYGEMLYLLSHLRFEVHEAKPHWDRIVSHRQSMQRCLGSPVDFRIALISYFLEVNRQLKNPKVIEMQIFESERASASRDALTGLFNYRTFREHLEREVHLAGRFSQPLSVVMIDVDNFKRYNDDNGHEAGNRALSRVAGLLAGALRRTDFAARYGGEEFVLILPYTPKTSAHVVAERARDIIERQSSDQASAPASERLTISLGLATFPADASTAEELTRHADRALYLAKAGGKNQVALYGQSRRSYGRVTATMPGTFRTLSDDCHTLATVNMSEAGVLFRTGHRLTAGSLVEFTLRTDPDHEVTAAGRVVHVENAEDGLFRTAVHITDARNADRARLMRLVRDSALGLGDLPVDIPSDRDPLS